MYFSLGPTMVCKFSVDVCCGSRKGIAGRRNRQHCRGASGAAIPEREDAVKAGYLQNNTEYIYIQDTLGP